MTGSVSHIPKHTDAYALGVIRLMKKSGGENIEMNIPVPVAYTEGKGDPSNQLQDIQDPHNEFYTGFDLGQRIKISKIFSHFPQS